MPGFSEGWLGVPARPGKPRQTGLTHVMDKGLTLEAIRGLFETAGEYIDIVKLGWGTSYVTQNLERKLDVLREKRVVFGGTLFEVVYVQGKLDEYKRRLHELGLTHVEISDGTIDIPRDRKLELIADFAHDFTVLSEVGSKDSSVEYETDEWTTWLREELDPPSHVGRQRRRPRNQFDIFDLESCPFEPPAIIVNRREIPWDCRRAILDAVTFQHRDQRNRDRRGASMTAHLGDEASARLERSINPRDYLVAIMLHPMERGV